MLILKNIKRNHNSIEADYYDIDNNKGYMKVSLPDGKIIKHDKISEIAYGSSHVQRDLVRISVLDKLPTERKVLWY